MTTKAYMNAALAAAAGLVAVVVWAAALLLPAPFVQTPPALRGSTIEPAPAVEAESEAASAIAAEQPAQAAASLDPAVFGTLQAELAPARAQPPVTMLGNANALPLMSSSLTTLQSIGATFADTTLASALPQLGGAAALDGPADAGLDERVNEAALPDPQVPPPTGKIIALDASEGTKLDPLRQRNWDLNATQQVPTITPQR